MDRSRDDDRAITLPLAFKRREQPITLFRGHMEVRDSRRPLAAGLGRIVHQWLPYPSVAFVIPDQSILGSDGNTTLHTARLLRPCR
jgi:hypothetical protein